MNEPASGRPRFTNGETVEIARALYGLEVSAHPLPSDSDQNFRLEDASGVRGLLKISNASERLDVLDLQKRVLDRLAKRAGDRRWPKVLPTLEETSLGFVMRTAGDEIRCRFSPPTNAAERRFATRLVTWMPGTRLAEVKPRDPSLLRGVGEWVGTLDAALEGFEHPAARRELSWDLRHGVQVVESHLGQVADRSRRARVERVLDRFVNYAAPKLSDLPLGVIHGDANDHNLLVGAASPDDGRRGIAALIDFGDVIQTWTVADPAIAMAYAIFDSADPTAAAAEVAAGYHAVRPLSERELAVLHHLMLLRMCVSVCMSAHQQRLEPDLSYLSISAAPAWRTLEQLDGIEPELAHFIYRNACGFEPCPRSRGVVAGLVRQRKLIRPVVQPDPSTEPSAVFDLSVGSAMLAEHGDTGGVASLSALLVGRMRRAGRRIGIGRYDEARVLYGGEVFRVGDGADAEQRTIHMGIDLFMEAGTSVHAPLDGVVHSFADNANPLDYGPTILLEHTLAGDGGTFLTLYGHLSRDSLDGLERGRPVKASEPFARLGDETVNGGWPPHLHFQIVVEPLGYEGDFPGVAPPGQREVWRSLSPDPNTILRIPEDGLADDAWSKDRIMESRRRHLSCALSLSYDEPLLFVRGRGSKLLDESGRDYLDCVNNVAHVGHSHPHVVEAIRRQSARLNTNTRYLYEPLARYIEALCARFDERLSVCFLVNSGSEANDLALRLARSDTGRHDLVVIDSAYHGNLSSVIAISPYKFDGRGGDGAPLYVHTVPMPDTYRGLYRDRATAGALYARHVADAIGRASARNRSIAAFIAEPLLGCGGQIVPPPGFLREAFAIARAAGALCIADEVQVGFGRPGSRFWGYETQDARPDIVTLGKPIGNGHPLGAVVTTREIADSFANGMEYFNTYGGNPVSCAAGLAVLEVIDAERLQEHSLRVGGLLKNRWLELGERFAIVGDVRGEGLFLGVEFVLDRERRTPAPAQASYFINRMRERRVLLSTDGPQHNVIKIKPPLVFSEDDAERLIATAENVLDEDFLRVE